MVITDVNQVVYQGDGVTTAFPFTFRIIDATDVKLLLIDADGTETDITADYFVDTNTNTVHYPGYAPGAEPGLADQPAPVQEGQRLVVYRELPVTQEKNMGDKWPFFVIELALDKLTMLIQQVKGIWDRCLKVSVGQEATAPDFNYTVPIEAGKTFRVKDDGTGFELTEDPAVAHAAAVAAQEAAERAQGAAEDARNDAEAAAENAEAALDLIKEKATWFDNVAAMKAAAGLQVGMLAGTKGYYSINDGGSSIYAIRAKTQNDVEDGGSVIFLDNGNVAELITDGKNVYAEQFGAVGKGDTDDSTAVANAATFAKNIKATLNIGVVKISSPIDLRSNLVFGEITYIGNDHAIVLDSVRRMNVKGNRIVVPSGYSGGGLLLTNTSDSCREHNIDINEISVQTGNGIDILPVNKLSTGLGVGSNVFHLNQVESASGTAINMYIAVPQNAKPTWIGETQFFVELAKGNIGVNLELQDNNGATCRSTITGVVFHNLSVEGSVTGVRMRCPSTVRSGGSTDECIKSIYIHNMRCRETTETTMFLDAQGLLRDIMIYPTSPIHTPQWRLITTDRVTPSKIIARIFNTTETIIVGENLCSWHSKRYVEKPTNRRMVIFADEGSTTTATYDFGGILKYYKDEELPEGETRVDKYCYMPSVFGLNAGITSATINMAYHMFESAQEVYITVPKGCTVTLNYPRGGNNITGKNVTITNSDASNSHMYRVCVIPRNYNTTTEGNAYYITVLDSYVVDMGTYTLSI